MSEFLDQYLTRRDGGYPYWSSASNVVGNSGHSHITGEEGPSVFKNITAALLGRDHVGSYEVALMSSINDMEVQGQEEGQGGLHGVAERNYESLHARYIDDWRYFLLTLMAVLLCLFAIKQGLKWRLEKARGWGTDIVRVGFEPAAEQGLTFTEDSRGSLVIKPNRGVGDI
jgi:hypothetical protein